MTVLVHVPGELTATKLRGKKTNARTLSLATAVVWVIFSSSNVFTPPSQPSLRVWELASGYIPS